MTARRDIFRAENSRLNVFAEEIFVGVPGHGPIGRQVTTLRAHHDFVSFNAFGRKLPDGRADASLAALKSVIDRGVDHIDPAFHRRDGRRSVALIRLSVRFPEIGADSERGEQQPLPFSKMTLGSAGRELLRVARGSFFGSGFAHDAPSGG